MTSSLPVADRLLYCLVLEVGSGSGQHIHRFSKEYPNVFFQPTEYDPGLLSSIDSYAEDLNKEGHHIKPALELDATKPEHWRQVAQPPGYDLVVTTNVFHISPWIVGQSIVRGAGLVLKSGGSFVIYGPFKRNGTFNTESNREVLQSTFSSLQLGYSQEWIFMRTDSLFFHHCPSYSSIRRFADVIPRGVYETLKRLRRWQRTRQI